jgi:hypothetical protein
MNAALLEYLAQSSLPSELVTFPVAMDGPASELSHLS